MCAHPAAPHPALQERLTARRISLRLSDAALDALTDLGHNPEYGTISFRLLYRGSAELVERNPQFVRMSGISCIFAWKS